MLSELRLKFYVTDALVYKTYFGEFSLGTKYHSPFRGNDPTPSFTFKAVGDRIIWKDFGLYSDKVKDGIGFVQQLFGLSRSKAVLKIWDEIVMNRGVKLFSPPISKPLVLPYDFTAAPLQDFELEYYKTLWMDKRFLEFFNVHSLKSLRRLDYTVWQSVPENPVFIYLFSQGDTIFKAYRPLDPNKDKFRGQNNGHILEGYDQLPKNGEHLIINSSFKDTKVCRRLGYLGTNPTSENSLKTLLSYARELNCRFNNNIYILFDLDGAGRESTRRLMQHTGWKPIFLSGTFKDPADIVKNTGNYFELSNLFSKLPLITKYHI